jgi:hypothetical protein
VQLVEWSGDTLRKRALLPLSGHPLRAFEHHQEMIAVSDSNVRAFSLSDLDVADQTADLTIGTCTAPNTPTPLYDGFAQDRYNLGCSALAAHDDRDGWPLLLGLVALALPSLKRRCRWLRLERRDSATDRSPRGEC